MSPQPQQPSPWSSTKLTYRAIRPTDLPLFLAIAADSAGYANSGFKNAHLPTEADALDFQTGVTKDSLLGAIIWLPHDASTIAMSDEEKGKEFDQRRAKGEVVDAEFGTAIGELHLSALPLHKQHHRNTEIGLDILPLYQGKGYGSEAINWALEYAFRRVGLHRAQVRGFSYNAGAVRLYERLGFRVEGREREAVWWEGGWWDVVTFGMLEGEWRERQELTKREKGKESNDA